jgi:rhodanese-related sulfurtransferase
MLEAKQRVTIVDVDEREDYKSEHIPNAINIPSDEMFSRARREIPKEYRVIVYCRCQGNGTSGGSKAELIKQGYQQVSILTGGIAAWKEIGMPTAAPK